MFDIGFWELVVIGVVALVVIGPDRLPRVARKAGMWVGKMRGFVSSVKADIDRELRAEELKRVLDQQNQLAKSALEDIEDITAQTRESVGSAQKSAADALNAAQDAATDDEKKQRSGS